MTKDRPYRIAVIPGDGIGREVVPEGLRVLEIRNQKTSARLLRLNDFERDYARVTDYRDRA